MATNLPVMLKLAHTTARTEHRLLLFLLCLAVSSVALDQVKGEGIKMLEVGVELLGETMPLKRGQRLYQLRGLKASTWYEVKISYPASIPASFTIELSRSRPHDLLRKNRRLLNTEKLVFKAENYGEAEGGGSFVLVTVEAAGVVAQPRVQERESVLFNIMCEELKLGIPLSAWSVGALAVLCIVFTATAANSLSRILQVGDQTHDSKAS